MHYLPAVVWLSQESILKGNTMVLDPKASPTKEVLLLLMY
jgi:hypothetical protein